MKVVSTVQGAAPGMDSSLKKIESWIGAERCLCKVANWKKRDGTTLAYCSLRIPTSRFMSETWLEQHSFATEAFGVNHNDAFVWELAGLGLEQQFRATERHSLDESLKHN